MFPDSGIFTTPTMTTPPASGGSTSRRRSSASGGPTPRRRASDAPPRDRHDEGRYHPEWDERPTGGYYLCPACRADAVAEAERIIATIKAKRARLAERRAAR